MSSIASVAAALVLLGLAAFPGAPRTATREATAAPRVDTDISAARRHYKHARRKAPVQVDVPYRGAPRDSYWGEPGKWGGYPDTPHPFYPLKPGPF